MNAQELAEAVVHWLELERLFGRESLFNESSLKSPVHQYLTVKEPYDVELEQPFPGIPADLAKKQNVGRKKSIDFCLRRRKRHGGLLKGVLVDVVESKFVNLKRPFAQETLNDVFRLHWLKPDSQTEACKRWLLVAGLSADIEKTILEKGRTKKSPSPDKGLYGVLDLSLNKFWSVEVQNASSAQKKRWKRAADKVFERNLPEKIKTKLEGVYPPKPTGKNEFACFVWRVVEPTTS